MVARRGLGVVTAATLLAIDLVYVPKNRIPETYLLDAAMEAAWLLVWSRASGSAGLETPAPDDGHR
ncbi:hypothetical protein C8D87_10626 [Lentzea atacamensis]|uniref:Uncharacterized protein n=2 Tax=Lentzea TaxID=165301 RepID=A0ABX9E3Z4_9PSEU|nr:hypothetical protein [Lentzea atacamensis]RAS63625.1 hypothetical protein C8D87_10626 [Lentzea atacamensis]